MKRDICILTIMEYCIKIVCKRRKLLPKRSLAGVRAMNRIIRAQRRANEALVGCDFLMGLLTRLHGEQKYEFAQWVSKLRIKDIRRFHIELKPFPFINLNLKQNNENLHFYTDQRQKRGDV